jgi:hypothetical protein
LCKVERQKVGPGILGVGEDEGEPSAADLSVEQEAQ